MTKTTTETREAVAPKGDVAVRTGSVTTGADSSPTTRATAAGAAAVDRRVGVVAEAA